MSIIAQMAFDSADSRYSFFDNAIKSRGKTVQIGTALKHAYATDLGIYGSRAQLKMDCIRIFVWELKHLCYDFTETDVSYSEMLDEAFQTMRVHPENKTIMRMNSIISHQQSLVDFFDESLDLRRMLNKCDVEDEELLHFLLTTEFVRIVAKSMRR